MPCVSACGAREKLPVHVRPPSSEYCIATPASHRRWSLFGSTVSFEKYIGRGTAVISAIFVHVSPLSVER